MRKLNMVHLWIAFVVLLIVGVTLCGVTPASPKESPRRVHGVEVIYPVDGVICFRTAYQGSIALACIQDDNRVERQSDTGSSLYTN